MGDALAGMFAEVWTEEADASVLRSEADQIEAARRDVNALAEYAFTSPDGAHLVQAPHHRELQRIFDEHDRAIVWYPVEHGKTTQVIIRLCWLLGNHPDRQYAYVSSKAKQAEKVVAAVGREILTNERLKRVFPNLRPAREPHSASLDCWGDTAIRVEGAPPGAKDQSLAAYGVEGPISGSRLHGVFIDNVCDRDNTISPTTRQAVLDRIENDILTRVLPAGFVAISDTSWHRQDAPHVLAKRPGWHSIAFDAEVGFDGGEGPLWTAQFSAARLQSIRETTSKASYDRQYRNKPLSDSVGAFKGEHLAAAWGRVGWCNSLEDAIPREQFGNAIVCTGIDLAVKKGEDHDQTVLQTVLRVGHRYRLLHTRTERMSGAEILSAILDAQRRFHQGAGSSLFRVEDNGAQDYIVQMAQAAEVLKALGATPEELQQIIVRGATTTAKKRDLELGIPSLAGDFEMDRWDIPDHWETEQLREEMLGWSPDAHTGDRLMALWIARDGLRVVADPTVDYV